MKYTSGKVILFLCLMICLGVLNSGCSRQYKLERMFWQANKAAEPIFINKGSVPSFEFSRVLALFDKVINEAPESSYALKSKLRQAALFLLQDSFPEAQKIYNAIILQYADNKEICAKVTFLKAQAYEKQGQWPAALELFNKILLKYDKTQKSLEVPLYVARYYHDQGLKTKAQEAYLGAVIYFQTIADKYPDTQAALLCENLIVRTYLEEENWEKAVEYILKLDKKYKLGPDTLLVLARIYESKLNDPVKARKIYERIIIDYPKHKIVNFIKKILEKLDNQAQVTDSPEVQ